MSRIRGVWLKMKYDPAERDLPIIYVSINGSEPLPFYFDTGFSGDVVLYPEYVDKLGLKVIEKTAIVRDGSGREMPLRYATIDSLYMPMTNGSRLNINPRAILIADKTQDDPQQHANHTAGTVGIAWFREITMVLDFPRQELRFYPDSHPPLTEIPGTVVLPLTKKTSKSNMENQLYVDVPPPGASVAAQPSAAFLVDTGATDSSLPEAWIRALNPVWQSTSNYTVALGSTRQRDLYLLPKLPLGPVEVPDVLAMATMESAIVDKNLLGLNVLSRFRVTIDFRNGFVTLEPTRAITNPPRPYGTSGVVLQARTGALYVAQIARDVVRYSRLGSAEAEQGELQVGDRVLSIGERSTEGMRLAMAQVLLGGYADTVIPVEVERDGKRLRVLLYPRREDFRHYDQQRQLLPGRN
ncbi:MAG: hypothetical protein OHK0029_22860 [Armatimonadaceae bacterium]